MEFADEEGMIRQFMRDGLVLEHGISLEDAIAQYKEAIAQAGGLEEFVNAYDSRREAQREAARPQREATHQEIPSPVPPLDKNALGKSAFGRMFFRRKER